MKQLFLCELGQDAVDLIASYVILLKDFVLIRHRHLRTATWKPLALYLLKGLVIYFDK